MIRIFIAISMLSMFVYPTWKDTIAHTNKVITNDTKEQSNDSFILDWNSVGVNKKEVIQQWNELGVNDIATFKNVQEFGITSTNELEKWINDGNSINNIYGWNMLKIKKWEIINLGQMDWSYLNIRTAKQMQNFIKEGWNYYDIKAWSNIPKITQYSKAIKWINNDFNYYDAKNWIDIQVTSPDIAKSWKEAGFTYDNAFKWKQLNIHNPKNAKDWIQNIGSYDISSQWINDGFTFFNAEKWSKNVGSYSTSQKWIHAGYDYETAKNWTILDVSIENLQNWLNAKYHEDEIKKWVQIDIYAPKLANKWKNEFLPFLTNNDDLYIEIKKWIDLDIKDPTKVIDWVLTFGSDEFYKYEIAKLWIEAGITDPKVAKEWEENYFSIDDPKYADVKSMHSLGIYSGSLASRWFKIKEDTSVGDIRKWIESEVRTPEDAKRWIDMGIDSYSATRFIQSGIKTPEDAKKWIDMDIDSYSTTLFIQNGVRTPEEAKKWIDVGINEYTIEDWMSLGVKKPDDIKLWNLNNINLKTGLKWKDVTTNPKEIRALIQLGLKRKAFYKLAITPKKLLSILKSNKCDLTKKLTMFEDSDEYENSGNCYLFEKYTLINRLDKISGIVSPSTSIINPLDYLETFIHITFDDSWKQGSRYSGILMGKGNYRTHMDTMGLKAKVLIKVHD